MTIIEACRDPNLFGPWFKDPGTWAAWQAFLSSLFGLDMDKHQRRLYRACTGRKTPPRAPLSEAWLVSVHKRGVLPGSWAGHKRRVRGWFDFWFLSGRIFST